MKSNVIDALTYWFRATLWPKQAIIELKYHPNKLAVAVWINVIFAALYAITALIYYAIGRLPAVEPWMPISPEKEKYYLYQIFWTIPWGLITWIAFSGVAHLLAIAGPRGSYAVHLRGRVGRLRPGMGRAERDPDVGPGDDSGPHLWRLLASVGRDLAPDGATCCVADRISSSGFTRDPRRRLGARAGHRPDDCRGLLHQLFGVYALICRIWDNYISNALKYGGAHLASNSARMSAPDLN